MKLHLRRGRLLAISSVLSIVLLVGYALFFVLQGLNHIVDFNGEALNGAFQLLNPLRRLDAGEIIGRDFQFFHGPLIPLLHFPLYEFFGNGLLGSELSRWLMSPLLFFVSSSLFLYGWFQGYKPSTRLKLVAVGLSLVVPLSYVAAEIITPSNSLLGIRTTFPLIVGAAFFLTRLQRHKVTVKSTSLSAHELLMYTLLALSFACGTEQGIAATLSFLLLSGFIRFREQTNGQYFTRIVSLAGVTAKHTLGIAGLVLIVFSLLSLGHPLSTLSYVFVEVPKDQFWYFGAYPQGFLTPSNIVMNLTLPYMRSLYAWLGAFLLLAAITLRANLLSSNQKRAIGFIFIYALLTNGAMLSYFNTTQAYPTVRMMVILSVCLSLLVIIKIPLTPRLRYVGYGLASLLIISTVITSFDVAKAIHNFNTSQLFNRTKQALVGNEASILGADWSSTTTRLEKTIREEARSQNPALWSTYSSIIERDLGQLHQSSQGHDYIIHALGPERRQQYADDFIATKPEFVTTIRPSYSIFEEWMWDRHWDFYRPLLDNYRIIDAGHAHFLWQRSDTASPTASPRQSLQVKGSRVLLPKNTSDSYQVLEVTITYQPDGLWSVLPMIKNLPRYLIQPMHTQTTYPISLPAYGRTWTFPVVLKPESSAIEQSYLEATTQGLAPGAGFVITSTTYQTLNIAPENIQIFTEAYIPK